MITKEQAKEKVSQGHIRVWLLFEVLATKRETAKDSLEALINRLDGDERAKLYEKKMSDVIIAEKPMKDIEFAYSCTAEVEFVVKNFDELTQIVTEYGPSAIEVLEPEKLVIPAGQAQMILTTISQMMHQYAAAGLGGIVFIKEKRDKE